MIATIMVHFGGEFLASWCYRMIYFHLCVMKLQKISHIQPINYVLMEIRFREFRFSWKFRS